MDTLVWIAGIVSARCSSICSSRSSCRRSCNDRRRLSPSIVLFVARARRARIAGRELHGARATRAAHAGLERVLGPIERLIYRAAGVRADARETSVDALRDARPASSTCSGSLVVYGMQRLQDVAAAEPAGARERVARASRSTPPSASRRTRTGRAYGGETTMSYLVADGRARRAELRLRGDRAWPSLVALIRGFTRSRRRRHRQLLGRSSRARPSTSSSRSRSSSRCSSCSQGVVADVPRVRRART